MKPGKKDIPVKIKISGEKLYELQKYSWHMTESFGLDKKIDRYKGVRPISLYSWDLECIVDTIDTVLSDAKEYPDQEDEGYLRLQELFIHLKSIYKNTYER